MIDQLIDKIRETGNPSVVGLDPTPAMIPEYLKRQMYRQYGQTPEAVAAIFTAFNRLVIEQIWDLIPAVKPQIAMYEQYGIPGLTSYMETIRYAKSKGLIVIGDIKRGDIGSTAAAYASHIGGVEIEGVRHDLWKEDAITVNPYFGTDGIQPFVAACKGRGIFVLIRSSNPGSAELQELETGGEAMYLKVADLVAEWGKDLIGQHGYSEVGAVVGATWPEQGSALRERLPNTFFLVPGYGAQGGKAEDLAGFFDKNGDGAIVNSSRGILAAWQEERRNLKEGSMDEIGPEFAEAARRAVIAMRDDLRRVWKKGGGI
jgi:orotidine-5'-phosphate decarboxylase